VNAGIETKEQLSSDFTAGVQEAVLCLLFNVNGLILRC
jgi:hypothetical protein